ncbi:MAG: hypothetical protein HOV94_16755 [Saccharothrix sp.]|nr:hypothetical protein [Saccharothrix sp.]
MSAAEPHTVAWTVEHIETEPLADDDRDASVNDLATLINIWNEMRRGA